GWVGVGLDRLEVVGLTPTGSIVLSGSAAGPRSDVAVDFGLALPDHGSAHLGGHVDVGLPGYRFDFAIAGVDPRALRADLRPGRVNLRLSARGQGLPGQPDGRLFLSLSVGPSRVQGIDVHEAEARVGLDGTRWRLESLEADAAGIRARAHGQGDPHTIALEL